MGIENNAINCTHRKLIKFIQYIKLKIKYQDNNTLLLAFNINTNKMCVIKIKTF